MAYTQAVLERAEGRLARARESAERENDRRIGEIYDRYPRLREIDCALRSTMAKVIAASMNGGDPTKAVEAARQENLALQEERSWLLQAAELEESELERQPVCAHCGGTGYMGAQMCDCLKELCRQEQKKELSSLLAGRETFEGFRLDYYSDEIDPDYGVSPRRIMEKTFRLCREYARSFSAGAPSLLFSGRTGLGKTCLSACIARSVAESGWSVVYDTAAKLFSDFEAEKFSDDRGITAKYLQCDLLIVDDLGTELVTQFTQSALYRVVNDRLREGRATIVSTNFTTEDVESTYSPQIASRLLGAYRLVPFCGSDIRRRKR